MLTVLSGGTLLMLLTLMSARDDHSPSVRISGGHVTVTSSISLNASAAARTHAHTHQTAVVSLFKRHFVIVSTAFSYRLPVQASTSLPASDTGAKSLRRAGWPFTRASWTATRRPRSPFPRRRQREAGPRSSATRDGRARPARRQRSGRWRAVTFSGD